MWLFRMSPIIYFLLAPVVLVVSFFMYSSIEGDEAAKTKARGHKAPEAVAIEAYDPAKHKSDFDEVVVLAQLDVATMSEVVKSKRGRERGRTTVGRLYPAAAKDTSAPAPAVLATNETFTDQQIGAMVVGNGAFGPIIRIDGRERASGAPFDSQTALNSGPAVATNAVFIEPFVNGRDSGLAPGGGGGGFLGFGAITAALVAAYGWWRRRREQKIAQGAADAAEAAMR